MALDPSSFFPSLNGSSLSNGGGNTNGGVAPIAGLFNIQQVRMKVISKIRKTYQKMEKKYLEN